MFEQNPIKFNWLTNTDYAFHGVHAWQSWILAHSDGQIRLPFRAKRQVLELEICKVAQPRHEGPGPRKSQGTHTFRSHRRRVREERDTAVLAEFRTRTRCIVVVRSRLVAGIERIAAPHSDGDILIISALRNPPHPPRPSFRLHPILSHTGATSKEDKVIAPPRGPAFPEDSCSGGASHFLTKRHIRSKNHRSLHLRFEILTNLTKSPEEAILTSASGDGTMQINVSQAKIELSASLVWKSGPMT